MYVNDRRHGFYDYRNMEPETAQMMARLGALLKSRGSSFHQLALKLGIRPASFTTGSLDRHWVRIARELKVSLDWLLLGDRDLVAENERLTAIIADLSARLRDAQPGGPTPSERELAARRLRQVAAELEDDVTQARVADLEQHLARPLRKDGDDRETGGRSA